MVTRTLRKQDRQDHCFEDMFIPAFPEDRKLDPVRAVKLYLKSVAPKRGKVQSLFVITSKNSSSSPSAQTIARWIVDAINLGMDNTSRSRAHSTRSTSTSTALMHGVGIANILRAADWSGPSTFANHYLKDQRGQDAQFGRAVIGVARQ